MAKELDIAAGLLILRSTLDLISRGEDLPAVTVAGAIQLADLLVKQAGGRRAIADQVGVRNAKALLVDCSTGMPN